MSNQIDLFPFPSLANYSPRWWQCFCLPAFYCFLLQRPPFHFHVKTEPGQSRPGDVAELAALWLQHAFGGENTGELNVPLGISGMSDICTHFPRGVTLTGSVNGVRRDTGGSGWRSHGAVQLPPRLGAASTWEHTNQTGQVEQRPLLSSTTWGKQAREASTGRVRTRAPKKKKSPAPAAEATSPSARGLVRFFQVA